VPANPIFSTHRTGDNPVTSSITAVFERLDLALVRDVLAAAAGAGDELRAVTFENQIVGEGSVLDARITGRFTWWFETKMARGGYAGAKLVPCRSSPKRSLRPRSPTSATPQRPGARSS
jgi:hypothetical protein